MPDAGGLTDSLGWVDIGLALFLVLSIAVGLARGFVFELMSLVGWFVAGFLAVQLAPFAELRFTFGTDSPAIRHGIALALVFFIAIVIWGVGARLVRAMIRATPLRVVDRLLGAGFGLVRGAVVLLLVSAVVGLSPLRESSVWQQSHGAAWLESIWRGLHPLLFDADPPGSTTV